MLGKQIQIKAVGYVDEKNPTPASPMKNQANYGGVLQEIKDKVPKVEAGKDHAQMHQALYHYMNVHEVYEEHDDEGEDIDEHFAQEVVQLKPAKQMAKFNRAIVGLLDIIRKNEEMNMWNDNEDDGIKICWKEIHGVISLKDSKIGKDCGTKETECGK